MELGRRELVRAVFVFGVEERGDLTQRKSAEVAEKKRSRRLGKSQ
jgi:hypothetical protein